jgi:hypothetical protein
MRETLIPSIAAVIALAIITGGFVTCERQKQESFRECIRSGTPALECKAATPQPG